MTTGGEMYEWMRSQGLGSSRGLCQWCGYQGGMRVFSGGQIWPPNMQTGQGVGLVCDFCDIPPSPETEDGLDPISRRLWAIMDAMIFGEKVHRSEHEAGQYPRCRCSLFPQVEPPADPT